MNKISEKRFKQSRRALRVRAAVHGTPERPRLSVFRSAKHFYAQVIDDINGKTLVSAHDVQVKDKVETPADKAKLIGKLLAERAKAVGISEVVFDRGRFAYHGQVKAAAEGAREGGLIF
ncbi:MAG: 50S ribosomal protein L18 [Patescibacteria group bacterium]